MMDELDLVKRARPDVAPPAAESREAARQALAHLTATSGSGPARRRARLPLIRGDAVAIVAALGLACVVFAGALILLGGQRRPAAGRPDVASRRALIQMLGVLRRPQTAADRSFAERGWPTPSKAPGSRIAPDRSLTRLATVTPWGANVFLVPLTQPRNPGLGRELGETVALWVHGIGWSDYAGAADIANGQAWGPQTNARARGGALESRFFEIVPDGVAKVVFYLRARAPRPGAPPHFSGTLTAEVHDNVAVFQTSVAHRGAYPVSAAWYAADGRLLKRVGDWNISGGSAVSVRKLSATTYCVERRTQTYIACDNQTPSGYSRLHLRGVLLIDATFRATTAVTGNASDYEWALHHQPSPGCPAGEDHGTTQTTIRPRQQVVVQDLVAKRCRGLYRGVITYQPHRVGKLWTLHATGPVRDGSTIIGRFTVTIP